MFSLGVCLYETLTGKNPFLRKNPVEALDAVRSFNPPTVSRHDAALKPFDAIIAKALAKRRSERFGDGKAMAEALRAVWRQLREGEPLSASMRHWFAEEIHDEQHLARVALEDADTGVGRRPTNVDKRAVADRNRLIGIGAGALVAAVLVTALITRAVVHSHDIAVQDQLIVAATSDAVQPKLGELVVKPATAPAAPVAVPPPVENPPTPKPTEPPRGSLAPAPVRREPAKPKPRPAPAPALASSARRSRARPGEAEQGQEERQARLDEGGCTVVH